MNTKIYSVFPACGKTWFCEHQDDYGLNILDSDSSQFSWIETVERSIDGEVTKKRNPDFPNNYIQHIKDTVETGLYDYIFVSSHKEVRDALDEAGIKYTIVRPEQSCLAEWVGRCYLRQLKGNNGFPIEVLVKNWDEWIGQCFECGINHEEIVLTHGEYLSDILQYLDGEYRPKYLIRKGLV